jgi:hypothetical protein
MAARPSSDHADTVEQRVHRGQHDSVRRCEGLRVDKGDGYHFHTSTLLYTFESISLVIMHAKQTRGHENVFFVVLTARGYLRACVRREREWHRGPRIFRHARSGRGRAVVAATALVSWSVDTHYSRSV